MTSPLLFNTVLEILANVISRLNKRQKCWRGKWKFYYFIIIIILFADNMKTNPNKNINNYKKYIVIKQ